MAYVINISINVVGNIRKDNFMPTGRSSSTDLRVRKSIRDIKRAVLVLIAKEPFEQIRIEEIAREAMINRKTFYNHFSSKTEVLHAIEDDMVEEQKQELDALEPDDLRGGLLAFYKLLNTNDAAYQALFTEDEYAEFFGELVNRIFTLDFYTHFYQKAQYPEIMPGYFSSAAAIYRKWAVQDGKKESLEELATLTARLFSNGMDGLR